MRTFHRWLAGGCAIVVAACAAPHTPPPAPAPAGGAHRADSAAATEAAWEPRRGAGTWRYEIRSEAIVALTGDTATEQVPVRSFALYTVTLTPSGDHLRIEGRVDSATVVAGGRVPPPEQGDSTPPVFRGELLSDGAITTLESATMPPCAGGTEPAVAAVHSLFVRTPGSLAMGTTWSDTLTTVTCRGDLPITTTAVRNYRVLGQTTWNGRPALEIERKGTITLASADSGVAARRIKITGSGAASSTLRIDPATGLLLTGSSSQQASLTITTGRSTLPFRQEATETITLRP